jgi:hypothetical protein
MWRKALTKGTTMPPAKNSIRSDLLLHKPTNSGEEPNFDFGVPGIAAIGFDAVVTIDYLSCAAVDAPDDDTRYECRVAGRIHTG